MNQRYAERMNVELRYLQCLVAIVDHGGFTGAAAELGVSQPAVSRGLAALERELGVRLLRRTSREVVPTAVGERVLAKARRILGEVEELVRDGPPMSWGRRRPRCEVTSRMPASDGSGDLDVVRSESALLVLPPLYGGLAQAGGHEVDDVL